MDVPTARRMLHTRSELERGGISAHELRRGVSDRSFVRVRAGAYVVARDWGAAATEDQHTMQVVAAVSALRGSDLVVCSASAAVLLGLPLYRLRPRAVHVAGRRCDGRVNRVERAVARHDVAVPAEDRTAVFGIPCTSLDRTVFDVVRTLPYDAAVACADAALHQIAWNDRTRTYDVAGAAAWKARMRERVRRGRGMRGIRQARMVLEVCDGRPGSPLESVSRLRLAELGFRDVRLQVPVPGPGGRDFLVDFGLEDVRGWGEADGKGKYHELRLAKGASAREILDAEKAREDWIRGTTQRPMARWGAEHVVSAGVLGSRLAAFGMLPPR